MELQAGVHAVQVHCLWVDCSRPAEEAAEVLVVPPGVQEWRMDLVQVEMQTDPEVVMMAVRGHLVELCWLGQQARKQAQKARRLQQELPLLAQQGSPQHEAVRVRVRVVVSFPVSVSQVLALEAQQEEAVAQQDATAEAEVEKTPLAAVQVVFRETPQPDDQESLPLSLVP